LRVTPNGSRACLPCMSSSGNGKTRVPWLSAGLKEKRSV
jgi:hypothetical protein